MRPLLCALLFLLPGLARADEWWAWSTLEFWKQEPFSANVFLANRLDYDDGAYLQLVSPRLRYAATSWLDLQLGMSLLNIENTGSGDRYWQGRPELEINPKFALGDQLSLEWRNRMEWRWREEEGPTTGRSRHRLQLAWKLPQPLGPLTRLFVSNEWLVDLHRRQFSENRLVPLGLTFRLNASTDLDLFYMLFATRHDGDWENETVIGTHLRVRF